MMEDKDRKNVKRVSVLSKRLTKKRKCRLSHGEEIVICNHDKEECNDSCMKIRHCEWYRKAMEKLKEYEDLEEEGLLLRLPCKIGDTVWEIVDECEGDNAGCYGTCDNCHNRRLDIEETKFSIDVIDEIGNWYFLTQSEAEEKLRELEGNNDN